MAPQPRKLLVIKPSSLGDIIHSLIVLQTVKDHLPDLEIHFVVRDRFAQLPEAATCVDKIHHFHRKDGPKAFLRLVRQLRETHYDLVWDMQGLLRSGLMMGFAKADRKVGRSDTRECSGLFAREKVPTPPDGSPHAVDKLLQFLTTLDLPAKVGSQVRFSVPDPKQIDPRLDGSKPIVMIPHSRGKEKEWPGFEELTRLLLAENLPNPIVWDSHLKIDAGDLEQHPSFVNTTEKTSVAEMIGLVQSAGLVVANDCGPMHLASAFQIPTIAIFGPTTFERFGAYPIESTRNANLQAPNGDWSKLPIEEVKKTALRLLGKER